MAISRSICSALIFICIAVFLVCVADEVNNKNDKTIRGNNVKARILGRSGKIMIARSEKDDDGKDDKDDGKDDKDRDVADKKDDDKDGKDSKDSVDNKDADNKDDKDKDNDRDDTDDKDDDDDDDDDFKDDNEDLLSFELDEIKEKDSNDNDVADDKHSVDSFDDVNFKFSPIKTNYKFQGLPVITVNLSAHLEDPDADLGIMVYLFRQAGTIRFGNETFAVQAGTVKFNIKISDWKFCADKSLGCSRAGEYLDLALKVKSKGAPSEVDDDDRKKANKKPVCDDKDDDKDDRNDKDDDDDNDDDDDDDDDCPHIYDMGGDSEMLLNKGVMIDDNHYSAMPGGFPRTERDGDSTKFIFRIPKFSKNVLVDPSVTPGEKPAAKPANAASWMQFNVIFTLLLQLAVMFAAH